MEQTVSTPDDGKAKHATRGVWFAGVSLITWLLPIIGVPVAIAGLVFGIKGLPSTKHTQAVVAVVLSVIGLVLGVANAAIGAYLGASGQLF